MLAKVLVLAFVAVASCENYGYGFKAIQEPAQEYRHYEQVPAKVYEEPEPAREAHYSPAPAGQGNSYSPQSYQHVGFGGQEGSQESQEEHVAPVYQYVHEEGEAPARYAAQEKHYQNVNFIAPAPVHNEHVAVHAHQPHATIRVAKPHIRVQAHHNEPHYPHGHEELSYHHGAQLHAAPVQHTHYAEAPARDSHDEPIDYYAYPKYQYEYKVEDPHTGDNKFQHEYRDGDVVKGVYSLQEADGSFRTVEYSSDKHTGFNAIVKHSAPGQHVQIESHHNN